ncbi:hypothetical protein HYH03_014008 [Edaphochlamys debaryana]|uniref:Novel STAND NTPase 1 domain-containing protein n=1 Tax=Edaphochlamys debaryana TaxID=47281 RepID=A0A835XP26_9CHLO|nr:hypothetical protein HYH03_014008 [Edaphochlamys debaryana]|eukprot:KAG2487441.1 hypothetical protein HYH03_014008 [Edaphochlamys debaryana]
MRHLEVQAQALAKAVASGAASESASSVTPLTPEKPLEDWDAKEAERWFGSLPNAKKWRACLPGLDGGIVAHTWSVKYLIKKGIPEEEAVQLVAFRDEAAARVSDSGTRSSAASSVPAGVKDALDLAGGVTETGTVAFVTPSDEAAKPVAPGGAGPGQAAPEAVTGAATPAADPALPGPGPAALTPSKTAVAAPSSDSSGEPTEEGGAPPTEPKASSLAEKAKKGLVFTRDWVERVGPFLPFPGGEAANLVLAVLDLVDTAVANGDNLRDLKQAAMMFLGTLAEYHKTLEKMKRYKDVVGQYNDLLQGIKAYAESYANRKGVVRLLLAGVDADTFKQLEKRMRALWEQVLLLLEADSNGRVQDVQDVVEGMQAVLTRMASVKDPSREAREFVEQNGGLEAVVAAGQLGLVVKKLDVGDRVTIEYIETVSSLLRAHLNKGPHQHITQPDLQTFWFKQFGSEPEVPWLVFWGKFPSKLTETLADAALVKELSDLLADEARRQALQRALDKYDPIKLSVWELYLAFDESEALLPQVRRLLGDQRFTPQSQLPPLPAHYTGRDYEAEVVAAHLRQRGSLLLLAPGGMGKSSLAADVAARLLRSEGLASRAARALWVELREAGSVEAVEARFCAALGVKAETSDNAARILVALRALAEKAGQGDGSGGSSAAGAAVVVVDNAEDALQHPAAAEALRGLIRKVLEEAPAVRLLLTSREPLGGGLALEERRVGAIDRHAAARLVQAAAADLTIDQAEKVADACQGVPLVLKLVSEALVYGRLTLESLPTLKAAAAAADGDPTRATVGLVLKSLHARQLEAAACLAVFPSAFNAKAADAVLALPGSQPRALLKELYEHGVLNRVGGQRYIMHMLVREQAVKLGAPGDKTFQPRAEGRFAQLMLRQLQDWSVMLRTKEQWPLSLTAAREQQADLGCLFELLQGLTPEHGLDVADVALGLTDQVADLLIYLGLIRQMRGPCEALLAQLESAAPEAAAGQRVDAAMASVLYMLGEVHRTDGRYDKAVAVAERSLDLRRHALGPEHPDTFASMDRLALCIYACGRCEEAEPLLFTALEQRQRILGGKHPDTISALNNLAICVHSLGGFYKAAPLYRKALALYQEVLGPEHPDTNVAITNMASCLQDQGRFQEAEELYRKALTLRQRVLGPKHPEVIDLLNLLASCMQARGRYEEAELLYREALELSQRLLGPEHPTTIGSFSHLAVCLQDRGRDDQAEPLFRQALDLAKCSDMLGPEHASTIACMQNLASCIQARGRYMEAELLYRQALELAQCVQGAEHPDTITTIRSLVGCLHDRGRSEDAGEALYRKALALSLRALGPEYPDTIASMSALANWLMAHGRLGEAKPLYRQALDLQQSMLGPEHPDTIACRDDLTACLRACNGRALQLGKRVLGLALVVGLLPSVVVQRRRLHRDGSRLVGTGRMVQEYGTISSG